MYYVDPLPYVARFEGGVYWDDFFGSNMQRHLKSGGILRCGEIVRKYGCTKVLDHVWSPPPEESAIDNPVLIPACYAICTKILMH